MDDQQPGAKDGDNINIGNIENSNVVAVGAGATAVYNAGLSTEAVAELVVELQRVDQPKLSTRAERIRHTLIQNVRSIWVDGVLHHANDILLSLDLTYTPDALQRDAPILLRDEEGEAAINSSLLEVFEENGRRLLILGEPGSGKTFTLLQLTEDLLNQADHDLIHPIPVVLNLSSWALTRKPLSEWIAEEMLTQYQVARKVTKAWLEQDELLLMLDGLDEVDETHRNDCLLTINTFMAEAQAELVVCSRIGDYEQLKDELNVSTAVRIQPLTDSEIARYLSQPGLQLQTVLATDSHLHDLARSPLMLTVMTLAYQGLSQEELKPLNSAEERNQHLFGKYVEQVFKRRPMDELSNNIKWLSHLARGMSQERQSIFYIERLQPSWLPSERWYLTLAGILTGLFLMPIYELYFGLILGVVFELLGAILTGLFVGVLGGMLGGILGGLCTFIGSKIKNKKVRFSVAVLATTLLTGLINGLLLGPYFSLIGGLLGGLNVGLLIFNEQIETVEVLSLKMPTWRTWATKFGQGALFGLLFGVIVGTINTHFGGVFGELLLAPLLEMILNPLFVMFNGLRGGLLLGLYIGLIFGLITSATTFLQPREIERKSQLNQGVRSSIKKAFGMLIMVSLLLVGVGALVDIWLFGSVTMSIFALLAFYGLPAVFFYYGGATINKHYAVRFLLALYRILPLKLVPFLDAMDERIILRRVGGGYIFIHRYLLEYFAGLEDTEEVE